MEGGREEEEGEGERGKGKGGGEGDACVVGCWPLRGKNKYFKRSSFPSK